MAGFAVVYVPYNETYYVNLNQLLLKEGYAEARDYPNEFNPDVWIRSQCPVLNFYSLQLVYWLRYI